MRLKTVSAAFLMLICFSFSSASAEVISFGDTAKYWPGWYNNTGDDNKDTIGDPNFNPNNAGGSATFDGGKLTSLSFTVANPFAPSGWNANLTPGDLFLSTNSDSNWEYIVDLTIASTWVVPGPTSGNVPGGNYSIYAVDIPLGSSGSNPGYTLTSGWSGFDIRESHPVAWGGNFGEIIGEVYFSGWGANPSFDFTNLSGGLMLGGPELIIGWTVNCANDVIYEKISAPVPEPATMLLLGTGLVGLAGLGRRKFLKK